MKDCHALLIFVGLVMVASAVRSLDKNKNAEEQWISVIVNASMALASIGTTILFLN